MVSDGAKTFLLKNCFHSGVVGTTCHVVLGRHLFLCHFKVLVMGFTFCTILALVISQMSLFKLTWRCISTSQWVNIPLVVDLFLTRWTKWVYFCYILLKYGHSPVKPRFLSTCHTVSSPNPPPGGSTHTSTVLEWTWCKKLNGEGSICVVLHYSKCCK